ncbi:MAG: tyrosine-type recombinase/integrase [Epulopiscium sp.]|nr:tyrosine-type recombinase/integrase [Candidatus Epulonipiscium sp.]
MNLYEASSIYIQSLQDIGLSPNTISSYKTDLKQFTNKLGLDTELDDLTYPIISNFFAHLNEKDLAYASLKRKRVVIQNFLRFCYEKRLCKYNHADLIDPMRGRQTSKPKDVLTPKEIRQIMDYLDSKLETYKDKTNKKSLEMYYVASRNMLLINILLYTGCRASEAVSIKKDSILLEDNTIEILAKGSKHNKIPIHNNLKKALENHNNQLKYLKGLDFTTVNNVYLFPSKKNIKSHISTRTLYDLMIELSGVIGRDIHAHLFRHTFASYSIASGMNIATLSSIVSHSNPAITLSIYTHEIESHQKQEQMKKLQFEI